MEVLEARDDDQLALLARGGVSAAFEVLVRRHQSAALGTAQRQLGGDGELAKDAVQNAFLAFYRYLPRYRPQGRLRVLLFRMLINECRMLRRSAAARARRAATMRAERAPSVSDRSILERERARELQRLVDALPPKQRAVVALRYGADLEHREIAEILRVPEGTVRSRLFHALRQLRKASASLR